MPIAVDIRLKNILLQARVNDFHICTSKVLWGNAFAATKKTFIHIIGRDYSLAILKNAGDNYKSPYWVALHLLYGNYKTIPEAVKLYDALRALFYLLLLVLRLLSMK